MMEAKVVLKNDLDVKHIANVVSEANRFTSEIFLKKNDVNVNLKSLLGVMSLALQKDDTITLIADGVDEESALFAVSHVLKN